MEYADLSKGMAEVEAVISAGPYQDSWESLNTWQTPQWFYGAKFGIFIHWGVFSVPAYSNEWYPRNMYIKGMPAYEHHIKKYGPQKDFGYQDFIPRYKMDRFDPAEWARVFKQAGARYVFPLAEHHDGFQMYRSVISRYNAVEMGPRRDLLGDLRKALLEEGLVFCTSSHRAEHWFFLGHGKDFDSDVREPLRRGDFYWPSMPEPDHQDLYGKPEPSEEYLQDWLLRCCELVDSYRPALLYFDWWVQHRAFKPYLKKFAAYYQNRALQWGAPAGGCGADSCSAGSCSAGSCSAGSCSAGICSAGICYKHEGMMFGSGIVELERGGFAECKPYKWQTDTPTAVNSWCYVEELKYKQSRDIVLQLIDVVSKNGNLLLNVGPKPDGTIPEGDLGILKDTGAWLALNGEGIYDSKVWRSSGEGPTRAAEGQFQDHKRPAYRAQDFRFTVKDNAVYAFALNFPAGGRLCIRSLGPSKNHNKPSFQGIIKEVSMLGSARKPAWRLTAKGLEIEAGPDAAPLPGFPVTFKVELL